MLVCDLTWDQGRRSNHPLKLPVSTISEPESERFPFMVTPKHVQSARRIREDK